MNRADGVGGLPRTVLNLAGNLAAEHDVEVISLFRTSDRPTFAIHPRVRVNYLIDNREPARRRAAAATGPGALRRWFESCRSRLVPPAADGQMSLHTDLVLLQTLRRLQPGVLISTRPSLTAVASRYAPRRVITVGQDHLNFPYRMRTPAVAHLMHGLRGRLDCLAVLTEGDARDYADLFGRRGPRVVAVPNALTWPVGDRAALTNKVVVAAGRLAPQKGFGRLIRAYAPVAHKHPDWQLRIFGAGSREEPLRHKIDELGLAGRVRLMGYTNDLAGALEQSSVFALSSVYEGFPMVLLEAMSRGVPMVGFDCPRGPADLIHDGVNGRLVPDGDVPAFTEALLALIEDEELRRKLGTAALASAHQYEMPRITRRWEELFKSLIASRNPA